MAKSWVQALYPDLGMELEGWRPFYDVFGKYRLCTDLWTTMNYLRRDDGSYSVDLSSLVQHFDYFIRSWRPWVIQVGCGCWGGSAFDHPPLYDAETGEPLLVQPPSSASPPKLGGTEGGPEGAGDGEPTAVPERAPFSPLEAMRLFYDALRPYIDGWGMRGRVYLQLWDEPDRDAWGWGVQPAYTGLFQAAPDIPSLCVTGIHPELQGTLDIFCPHTYFADREVYRMVREGISLKGKKAVPAQVTASSSGGWGNAAFYTYRPWDAYDGCPYTFWTAKDPPTADAPQWLQLAFEQPMTIHGMALVPLEKREPTDWTLSISLDGENFTQVAPQVDEKSPWTFHFDPVKAAFARFEFRAARQEAAEQPASPGVGLREIEFLGPELPREATLPRDRVRKARVWEYNVGADYPSFCIDSPAVEHRAIAWLCWERGVEGFLYYGGGWVPEEWKGLRLPETQPLDWPAHGTNGGQYLIYPGPPTRPLPSLRLAVMGEGMEDYEYLYLLREHLIAARLDPTGRVPGEAIAVAEALLETPLDTIRQSPEAMLDYRRRVAEAVEALGVKRET
jgi:hypothetical protein